MNFPNLTNLVLPFWLKPLIFAIVMAVLTGFIFHKGELHERAGWVDKENAELVQRQEKILELTTINRELERVRVIEADYLKTFYERKLNDEKTHADAVIADVRAGVKRLSIATRQTVPACGGGISLAAAGAAGAGEETRTELSGEAAEFLIGFGSEADEVTIEGNHVKDLLVQCRAHVEALRALANAKPTTQLTNRRPLNELQ